MAQVFLGDVPVGDNFPPVFIAEVGSFFNKDIGLALSFLRRIVEAKAPVFKTEILHGAVPVLRDTNVVCRYNHAHGEEVENYRKLIERKVVPLSDYVKLFTAAKDLKTPIIATVFDEKGVDFIEDMGAGIKISRNNLHHVPLLKRAGESGLPVILDTGEVYLSEISKAVELLQVWGQV